MTAYRDPFTEEVTDTWIENTRDGQWLREYQARRAAAAPSSEYEPAVPAVRGGRPRATARTRSSAHRLARASTNRTRVVR